jgi:hypothetical protein
MKTPRRRPFLERERERARERAVEDAWFGFGKKGVLPVDLQLAIPAPPARGTRGQSTTHPRTVREARGRSGTPARTVRYYFQNLQYCPGLLRRARTVRAAPTDGPPGTAGQPDQPFSFQLDIFRDKDWSDEYVGIIAQKS